MWTHYTNTFEVAYNCASRNKMHHCTYIMALVLTSVLYSYRPVVPPPGAGSSKVMSTSLPSSTHLATSTASASPGIPTILYFGAVVWPLHFAKFVPFLNFRCIWGKFRLSCNIYINLSPVVYTYITLQASQILLCVCIISSPAPKKSSSSGSGRKRTSSAKTPLSVPTLFPRVTRSSSRDKSGSGAQPSPPLRPFRSPSLPTPPLPTKAPPAPNPPPTTKSPERVASKKSPSVGPASKEKQRRYGG